MKKFAFILLGIASIATAYFAHIYLTEKFAFCAAFTCGTLLCVFLMNIFILSKNNKINSYARQLEKESILSTENSSKVKILESKIEVLEKALENALKK